MPDSIVLRYALTRLRVTIEDNGCVFHRFPPWRKRVNGGTAGPPVAWSRRDREGLACRIPLGRQGYPVRAVRAFGLTMGVSWGKIQVIGSDLRLQPIVFNAYSPPQGVGIFPFQANCHQCLAIWVASQPLDWGTKGKNNPCKCAFVS
jgi:hypothetical protein